jgi:hypothetical protein
VAFPAGAVGVNLHEKPGLVATQTLASFFAPTDHRWLIRAGLAGRG